MPKNYAPYRHKDGSNCWTKECSRNGGNMSAQSFDAVQRSAKVKEDIAGLPAWYDGPVPIDAIAPIEAFEKAYANKEVSRQRHPDYPYSIFKYSQSTTYTKNWNDVTLASRGLVINDETNEILARPFGKFFNYSEGATPPELMQGPISVTEKLDGSLGISYQTPDGMKITTAGGFTSDQAAHANALYQEKYEGNWKPRKGVTYMWEIIYPQNQIVVDYGDEDDIHLLGAVNIRTGKSIPLSELKEWKWKRAAEYTDMASIDSVVNADERPNHEGYIVHFTETDTRVKLKHEEYIRHHRYATGVNSRRIWEMLKDNEDTSSFDKNAPEEFEAYIKTTRAELQGKYNSELNRIRDSYSAFESSLPKDVSQKEYALAVNARVPKEDRSFFFNFRANGGYIENEATTRKLWDRVKPDFEKSRWSETNGVEDK